MACLYFKIQDGSILTLVENSTSDSFEPKTLIVREEIEVFIKKGRFRLREVKASSTNGPE